MHKRHSRLPTRWSAAALLTAAACVMSQNVAAQSALHLISPSPLPSTQALPSEAPGTVAHTETNGPATLSADQNVSFVLRSVQIEGATVIWPNARAALWQGMVGKTVTSNDIVSIGKQLAQLYETAGYALVNVQVPMQDYASGVAKIVVQEGYVDQVTIEGNTEGADLDLLKAYAAHIIGDRPLRQRTLERYILLMNDIAGLKVGSTFEPIPGHPGAAALHLAIARRHWEAGGALTTQGNNSLGSSQLTMNVVGDSLLHQGDRTQLAVGVPLGLDRYQYYGVNHLEPLGSNGATITVGVGELITHPANQTAYGSADTLTVRITYPLIRAVHESLIVNGDFNWLDSNTAYLGQSLSDERTRSLRLGAVYGLEDSWKGTTIVAATASKGIDFLGARRGSEGFGGPDYTKFNGSIMREQALPLDMVVRGKVFWQYSTDHLPSTEQFLFGGPDIGKVYNYAFMAGDRGLAPYIELAHPWPVWMTPDMLAGSEVFGYADYGEVWNVNTNAQLHYAHAASAGFGVRAKFLKAITLELGMGWVVNESPELPRQDSPRFLFNVGGHF
jgi:hemolysin activation/secretion protein